VGLLSDKEFGTYYQNNSKLGGHASSAVAAVEHSTGAIGHGLPVAVGIGIGLLSKKMRSNVYVIVGDGELHEGTNWEAMHLAGHLKLNNLCLLIDYNGLSGIGKTNDCCSVEPLKSRLESSGFEVHEVDGHNQEDIDFTLQLLKIWYPDKPVAIICHTVKGKGISFMENNNAWHYKPLNKEDYNKAIVEISK
jgi:transketolase